LAGEEATPSPHWDLLCARCDGRLARILEAANRKQVYGPGIVIVWSWPNRDGGPLPWAWGSLSDGLTLVEEVPSDYGATCPHCGKDRGVWYGSGTVCCPHCGRDFRVWGR